MAGCPLSGPCAHLNPNGGPATPVPELPVTIHSYTGKMEATSKEFGFQLGRLRPQEGLTIHAGGWPVQGQPQPQNEFQAISETLS